MTKAPFCGLLAALGALLIASASAAIEPGEYLREQRTVIVNGQAEVWQLVWQGKPRSFCGPADPDMAITCPCSGWAYGEMGRLDLVRTQGGKQIDRMPLGPLFAELPADKSAGLAAMQWRPMHDRDWMDGGKEGAEFVAEVTRRAGPRMIEVADYDHDGIASEFLIQTDTLPCGKHQYVAVGVSRSNPRLHALASVASPDKPLVMPGHVWQSLIDGSKPQWLTTWECDDHASEVHTDMMASARDGRIAVRQRAIGCKSQGNAGKIISNETY